MHFMIPHTLLQATRWPLSIYPGWLQYGLLIAIPYGAFNFIPASFLFGKETSPWTTMIAPLAAIFFVGRPGRLGAGESINTRAPVPKTRFSRLLKSKIYFF